MRMCGVITVVCVCMKEHYKYFHAMGFFFFWGGGCACVCGVVTVLCMHVCVNKC